jgi:adenylate cyclase
VALNPEQVTALVGWLQTTMGVLQSAIGSWTFPQQAAKALVSVVGFDSGRFLRLKGEKWRVVSAHPPELWTRGWQPSRSVLERLQQEKRTVWKHPELPSSVESDSLHPIQLLVAAPILDRDRNIIGVLYGERRQEGAPIPLPVELVALLVDLLACGLAVGLAREEQERVAVAARVRFEQFFTSELARQLALDEDFLKGREAEVTLLFCDIRGFSRVSRQLGPAATVRWVNDVLEELSQCTLSKGGVLVDYVGDELFAMWGAPVAQSDHAERAVEAALAMLKTLGPLNDRWEETLKGPMDLGVGLNTGEAYVGNTGCKSKFKYGPLGHAANLASRVQGVTKYLRCRLLVTRSTWEAIKARYPPDQQNPYVSRRVCKARMVNISDPVDLYELARRGSDREQLFRLSETALDLLEQKNFLEAARKAGDALREYRGDGPSLLTLSRATHMLVHEGFPFDPIWDAPGK